MNSKKVFQKTKKDPQKNKENTKTIPKNPEQKKQTTKWNTRTDVRFLAQRGLAALNKLCKNRADGRVFHFAKQGFTLIELMIVMAVIAILTGVLVPSFSAIGTRAKESASKSNIHTIQVALESYFLSKGAYPTGTQTIDALITELKKESALTQDLINPFTGKVASSTDKSGKITYTANATTGGYTLSVMGNNNSKQIEKIEN